MRITDALLGEHAIFYLLMQDIEQALPALDSLDALHNRIAPLAFSLEAHAALEDALLFVTLEPYLGVQGGPLAVMRMEHDQIVALLERILSTSDLARGRTFAGQVIDAARTHFHKEEQILFRMAQQALSEETLYSLGAAWAARRGPDGAWSEL
jgi:regulator of cell morphogenesis and NO signaling